MRKPNGETVTLNANLRIRKSDVYRISQDVELQSKLTAPHVGLFVENPLHDTSKPLQGSYELVLQSEWLEGSEFSEVKFSRISSQASRTCVSVVVRWPMARRKT
jgi:hypothetical protein